VWKNEWTSEWISIHTKKVVAGIFVQKKWKHRWDDVYIKAKSLVQDICNTYHISELVYKQTTQEYLHPNKQVSISKNNKILWSVSQIHPSTLESLWFTDDIEIAYFKLNLEDLFSFSQVSKKINYHSNADQYIQRDLSFEIDSQSHYDQIISVFQKNNIIEDYTVIDLYRPEWSIKKSIAIRFTIIWDTSLTSDKVTEITNTIISEVEATGAILKGVKA
jgi:phenylalanyl-tRNA synthetase beta subunit